MRTSRQLNTGAGAALLALAAALTLVVGWQREVARRYPVSDLPRVNLARIEEQLRAGAPNAQGHPGEKESAGEKESEPRGNLNRTEALFYRKLHAGSDTAQNR